MSSECEICVSKQQNFIDCDTCKKQICLNCYSKIGDEICPFCRGNFWSREESENDDDDVFYFPLVYFPIPILPPGGENAINNIILGMMAVKLTIQIYNFFRNQEENDDVNADLLD